MKKTPLLRHWAMTSKDHVSRTVRHAATVALGVIMFSAMPSVLAQENDSSSPNRLLLSTASTGGAFHQGGVSLSALVKIKLLPDQQIDLAASNSSGSLENIARLRDGTSDFAIVQALIGHDARSGTGLAADLGPQNDLRAVMMLWPNVEHFIIRKDLAQTGTIDDFQSLRDLRVSLGRERSAIGSNRVLLGNLGINIDRDVDQAFLSYRPSVAAFRRGEIDGLSLPASTPVPAFVDLMNQLGPGATLLSWTDEQRRQADGGLGLWAPLTIPANTYPGQTEPLDTIAQPNFLAVRADVGEEVVYAITKAVFENLPFLKRLHEPFQFLSPETAVANLPVPLHPGALRYYEEIRLDLGGAVVAENDYQLFGDDLPSPLAIRQEVGRGVVELMTTEDDASGLMIDDLMDVMPAGDNPRLLPIKGKGAAHNLADLVYLSGIDVAVLQADALERERERGVYPNLIGNIRYIAKWADAEIHLLVRSDILDIKDLRDQPVSFGPKGSGSEVTASLLFNQLRMPVRQVSESHSQALAKLKAGEIAAMVYVAPKPATLLRDVEVRDGLRFLSLPEIDVADLYRPADLTVDDYPSLIFGEQTVNTLAVPLVLATYNWPTDHERYQPIAGFVDSFLESLSDLQNEQRHAKWQDVDPAFDFLDWQRHPVVDVYLEQRRIAAEEGGRGGPLDRAESGSNGDVVNLPFARDQTIGGESPATPTRTTRHRPIF